MELHASTQMSITNAEGVSFAQSLGVDRVTLARELSLDEVRAIRAGNRLRPGNFRSRRVVRGLLRAMFFVGSVGRPQRQSRPMRAGLPAAVRNDGGWALKPLADARYLLSPGDLYALAADAGDCATGVAALKIEGRYKDAEYVALTTRAYRKAVDEAWAGRAS